MSKIEGLPCLNSRGGEAFFWEAFSKAGWPAFFNFCDYMCPLVQDAYIEHINKGDETYSAEGLAAMVREIFIIGAESESVLLR